MDADTGPEPPDEADQLSLVGGNVHHQSLMYGTAPNGMTAVMDVGDGTSSIVYVPVTQLGLWGYGPEFVAWQKQQAAQPGGWSLADQLWVKMDDGTLDQIIPASVAPQAIQQSLATLSPDNLQNRGSARIVSPDGDDVNDPGQDEALPSMVHHAPDPGDAVYTDTIEQPRLGGFTEYVDTSHGTEQAEDGGGVIAGVKGRILPEELKRRLDALTAEYTRLHGILVNQTQRQQSQFPGGHGPGLQSQYVRQNGALPPQPRVHTATRIDEL